MPKRLRINDINEERIADMRRERANGSSMDTIGAKYGVTGRTLLNWAEKREDIRQALDEGRNMQKRYLELVASQSLVERLRTRQIVDKDTVEVTKDAEDNILRKKHIVTKRTIEPDSNLIMYALKQANPAKWDNLANKRLGEDEGNAKDYGAFINKLLHLDEKNTNEAGDNK